MRALNQPGLVKANTLDRIHCAMQSLGYRLDPPASQPRPDGGTAKLIFVLLPSIGNPFYCDVVNGIKAVAKLTGYDIILMDEFIDEHNVGRFLQIFRQSHASGIIAMDERASPVLPQICTCVPVVQCCDCTEDPDVSYVSIDNLKATKNLMQYILAAGRRKIPLINGDPDRYTYAKLRLQSYLEVLEENSLESHPNWVVSLPEVDFSMAVSVINTMLQGGNIPDCIYCTPDVIAAAVKSCSKAGLRVPQDVMVVGFDNIDISTMTTPTVTTVSRPRFEIGFTACSYLIDLTDNPSAPVQHTILETELIIRESTRSF